MPPKAAAGISLRQAQTCTNASSKSTSAKSVRPALTSNHRKAARAVVVRWAFFFGSCRSLLGSR
eukprot:1406693-Alexandrium_andersonii.AAC.1